MQNRQANQYSMISITKNSKARIRFGLISFELSLTARGFNRLFLLLICANSK